MLGAAGCLAPEALAKMGVTPAETGVVWFRSGVIPPAGSYGNYWTDPYSLFLIEVVLMQFAELKRLQDFRFPGSQVGFFCFFGGGVGVLPPAVVCLALVFFFVLPPGRRAVLFGVVFWGRAAAAEGAGVAAEPTP